MVNNFTTVDQDCVRNIIYSAHLVIIMDFILLWKVHYCNSYLFQNLNMTLEFFILIRMTFYITVRYVL